MKKTFFALLKLSPVPLFIAAVIIFVDPLHTFNTHTHLNYIPYHDMRLIKTNIIRYEKPNFNALLIGSSRVQIAGDFEVQNHAYFNFGCGDLMPADYKVFIDFVKEHQSLDQIAIGLDFMGSSSYRFSEAKWRKSEEYIKLSDDYFYLAKTLIHPKCFKYSVNAIYNHFFPRKFEFTKNPVSLDSLKSFEKYYSDIYSHYEYNTDFKHILEELRDKNRDVPTIVFTTPVTTIHLKMLHQYNLLDDYRRWLKDISDVFGGFYHLMIISPLTTNPVFWKDHNHLKPDAAQFTFQKIFRDPKKNSDYFLYITPANLTSQLDKY